MEKKQFAATYAIWEKPTKNGGMYLSMKTPDGKWVTFFKSNKKTDKAPDWFQAPDREPATPDGMTFNSKVEPDFGPEPKFNDEEIPF